MKSGLLIACSVAVAGGVSALAILPMPTLTTTLHRRGIIMMRRWVVSMRTR